MPNGHTGGFTMSRDALRDVLRGIDDSVPAGWLLPVDAPSREERKNFSAREIIALIEQFSGLDVYVEEHDYNAFILHVDYDVRDPAQAPPIGDKWMIIEASSPLFRPLQVVYEREVARRRAMANGRSESNRTD